ncbi:MAG: hypothetical protein H7267_08410 [Sandarakinorhabdus sp.]|nr:hypothetical protein [Sandarakinorhabdus sp.]
MMRTKASDIPPETLVRPLPFDIGHASTNQSQPAQTSRLPAKTGQLLPAHDELKKKSNHTQPFAHPVV